MSCTGTVTYLVEVGLVHNYVSSVGESRHMLEGYTQPLGMVVERCGHVGCGAIAGLAARGVFGFSGVVVNVVYFENKVAVAGGCGH